MLYNRSWQAPVAAITAAKVSSNVPEALATRALLFHDGFSPSIAPLSLFAPGMAIGRSECYSGQNLLAFKQLVALTGNYPIFPIREHCLCVNCSSETARRTLHNDRIWGNQEHEHPSKVAIQFDVDHPQIAVVETLSSAAWLDARFAEDPEPVRTVQHRQRRAGVLTSVTKLCL